MLRSETVQVMKSTNICFHIVFFMHIIVDQLNVQVLHRCSMEFMRMHILKQTNKQSSVHKHTRENQAAI